AGHHRVGHVGNLAVPLSASPAFGGCEPFATAGFPGQSASRTEITRPRRVVLKSTLPARLAKIVSSFPIPTPSPGWNLVPRWRTMISPPVTAWPANTFTPRRLAFESRPLRLDPSPFL